MESEYGKKLAEAKPKYGEICLTGLVRAALVLVCVVLGEGGIDGVRQAFVDEREHMCVEGICVAVIVFLVTLLQHGRDKIEFYERGIRWRHKWYSFEELGEITWERAENRHLFFFDATILQTDCGGFNVSYVNHPRRAYNQAYMNSVRLYHQEKY